MKIPVFILSAILGFLLTVETWTLKEVVNLKVQVAALSAKMEAQKFANNSPVIPLSLFGMLINGEQPAENWQ